MAQLSADRYCKEGCVLFNDALSTFYLRAYGVGHLINIHLDNERGKPLQPRHQILNPISNKGPFHKQGPRHDSTCNFVMPVV